MKISSLVTLLLLGGAGRFPFDGLLVRLKDELKDETTLNTNELKSALEDLIKRGFVVTTTDECHDITPKGQEFLWSNQLITFIKKFHRASYYEDGKLIKHRQEVA